MLGFGIVLLILWAVGTPIVALVALARTARLKDEADSLRAALAHLNTSIREQRGGAPERTERRTETSRPAAAAEPAPPAPKPNIEPPAEPETAPAAEDGVAPAAPPSPAAPAPVAAASSQPSWAQASAAIERMIAANWLIWMGAGALALGGIFLVRFAWEQGYFGPAARTIAAVVVGLAMLGASEWLRRRTPADAPGQLRHAPLAVSAAGAVTLYAAAYAAGPLYQLIPATWALAGFVAVSAVAVALAVVHGPLLAALGLTGGYVAPLLVGGGEPPPLMLLAYAFMVTLAALVLVRAFNWRPIVWIALAGAGFWMLAGVSWVNLPSGPYAISAYVLALLTASTWLAWSDADTAPFEMDREFHISPTAGLNQTVIAAHGFWIIGGLSLLMAFMSPAVSTRDPQMLTLALYGAAAMALGWRRQGFLIAPLMGAAAFLVGLGYAPLPAPGLAGVGAPIEPAASSQLTFRFIAFAWAGAAIAGAGGWLAMRGMARPIVMAIVSAFVPPGLLFIAFERLGEGQQHLVWGLAGGLIGMLDLLVLEGLRRRPGGLDAAKGVASAYALAAFAGSMLAIGASLERMAMTVLFAAHLPAIALIDRRFNLPALRLCASIVSVVVMGRLLWPGEILSYRLSDVPVLNELALLYGLPLLCFWSAARVFAKTAGASKATLPQALDTGAIVLLAALAAIEIRHAVTGGHLEASYRGLVETSAYAISFTGMAIGMAARLGPKPGPWMGAALTCVYGLALLLALLGLGLVSNPLLGWSTELSVLDGPPLLNLLAPSYLIPALLFAVHAALMQRQGRSRIGHLSGFVAIALALLYVTLEVRNAFHLDLRLDYGPVTEAETYAYSIAWILFSVATLLLGVVRRQIAIRHAAMAVLALSVAKVFLLDMASLTGVLRAVSFLGLGVALIAIAFLYQRLVFRREPA